MKKIMSSFLAVLCVYHTHSAFAKQPAAQEVDQEILGRAGDLYIAKEACNKDGFDCDYLLYQGSKKLKVLAEDWSRTANVYQFTPQLMGFLFGATGSGHLLTLIDQHNQQKQFGDFKAINKSQSCFVTYETALKNMPDSLVFYSTSDFRPKLVINNKVPDFKTLNDPSSTRFSENGDFEFDYTVQIDGELSIESVKVQNPCQPNYKIIIN